MYKILFFIALFAAMYFAWRYSRVQQLRLRDQLKKRASSSRDQNASPDFVPAEQMVQCEYCKVFVPSSEAVKKNGKNYCCAKHARADSSE